MSIWQAAQWGMASVLALWSLQEEESENRKFFYSILAGINVFGALI